MKELWCFLPLFQEKVGALVDSLCVEAVEKILKIVEGGAVEQEETPGDLKDPPESEGGSECSMTAAEGELRTQEARFISV